ncbi:uncharacterized protein LOC126322713 [Schistocerca gregaria]|uniref:uncharacterized protein LOC126322713 n=1 Tax=Schistocerca gregaria TaxID=7010 RepID=UPI00211E6D5F|nr:uncharacterized protein LOC126322713 [Schistocerca gregaria]
MKMPLCLLSDKNLSESIQATRYNALCAKNHPSILAVWEASSPSALINDSDPSSCYSRANALVPHHLYEQGTSTNFQGCPVNHLINGGREVFMQTYLYLLRGMELNFPPPPSFSFSTSSATLMTPTSISLKSEIGSTDGMQYQSPAVKQENRDRMQAPACTLATNPRRTYSTNLADFRTDNLQTVGTMSDHHHQTISPSVPKFLVQPLKSSTLIKQPVTPSITPPSMWSASFVWSSCSLSNQLQEIVFYTALNQRIPSSIPKRLELMTIDKLKHLIDIRNLYLKIDLNFMNNQKAKFDLFLRDLYLVKYFGCHVLTYVLLVHFDNQKLWLSIFSIDSPNNNNTVESFSKQSLVQKSTNCTPVMNMNQVNTSNFNPAQRMLHSVQGKYTMGGYSGGNNASGYLAYVTALSPVVTTRNIQSELIPVSQNLISASIPAPPGIYLMLNSVSDSYSNTPMYQNSNTSNGAC